MVYGGDHQNAHASLRGPAPAAPREMPSLYAALRSLTEHNESLDEAASVIEGIADTLAGSEETVAGPAPTRAEPLSLTDALNDRIEQLHGPRLRILRAAERIRARIG